MGADEQHVLHRGFLLRSGGGLIAFVCEFADALVDLVAVRLDFAQAAGS
jgi:hypothetical protein